MGFWKKTYKFVGSWCARYLYMLYDIWRYIVVPKWLQMEGDLALSSSASALQKKGNLWSSRADGQINAIFLGYKLINPNACWWNPRQSICSPTIVYTHVTHLLFLVTSSHVTCVKRLSVCLIPLFSWLWRSNLWNVFEYGHGDCQSKWIKTYEIIWFFIWFFIWHFFLAEMKIQPRTFQVQRCGSPPAVHAHAARSRPWSLNAQRGDAVRTLFGAPGWAEIMDPQVTHGTKMVIHDLDDLG